MTFANYIGGEWTGTDRTFDNRNPADWDEVVGLFALGGADDVRRAVAAAECAFPQWASTPAPVRAGFLFKAADALERRLEHLATDMTREEGKTVAEATGEVRRSINIFRYFAGEGARLPGALVPSERDRVFMFSVRKPLGVVGLITPWNFPSAIPAWKLAPAIIAGNTCVLKPASAAPLSSWRLVEALHEAGIPPGVVNYVAGPGGALGDALIDAAPLKAVSFTGSCEIGGRLYDRAARRRLRIQLEMGGKNPTIVLADADLGRAVDSVVNGAFASTGQKCTATSRAIVEEPIYERFCEALVAATARLKIGNGLDRATDVGPLVDERQLDTVMRYIASGTEEGATLAFGGRQLAGDGYDRGYFVEPTIFTGVTETMTIAREEIFGPVVAVMRARDFDDAMRIANGVAFGLSASLQTTNLSRAFEYVQRIEAGLVTVNLPSAGVEYQLPFGGTKESSFGPKEQGPAALDFYTDWKTVYLRY